MWISELPTVPPKDALCAAETRTFALLRRLHIPLTAVRHNTAETMADCVQFLRHQPMMSAEICIARHKPCQKIQPPQFFKQIQSKNQTNGNRTAPIRLIFSVMTVLQGQALRVIIAPARH